MNTTQNRAKVCAQILRASVQELRRVELLGPITTPAIVTEHANALDCILATAEELEQRAASEGPSDGVLALTLGVEPVRSILGTRNVSVLWNYGRLARADSDYRSATVGDLIARSDIELLRINNFGTKGVERVAKLRAWVAEQSSPSVEVPSDGDVLAALDAMVIADSQTGDVTFSASLHTEDCDPPIRLVNLYLGHYPLPVGVGSTVGDAIRHAMAAMAEAQASEPSEVTTNG